MSDPYETLYVIRIFVYINTLTFQNSKGDCGTGAKDASPIKNHSRMFRSIIGNNPIIYLANQLNTQIFEMRN